MSERTASWAASGEGRAVGAGATHEWSIREVARATGLTSRALRHYEQIGLVRPSRVAANGYRFYGDAELSRLYRVLSLRALDLPLASIQRALDDERSLEATISAHLASLEERRDEVHRQIIAVRQTLDAVQKGGSMTIDEIFAGFDNSRYEGEVRERWGDEAWEAGARAREALSDAERGVADALGAQVNAALRAAAEARLAPDADAFQAAVAAHHRWVAGHWGRTPEADAYAGLAQLYVSDERFAAVYGGASNAEAIRRAIEVWIGANLLGEQPPSSSR
ncbi:MAG: MerR family transcriptional regulator [Microbacteriaceae bacterium]|nr:MerR family transcriptional regulator [Microbacteriaceae bacterium]